MVTIFLSITLTAQENRIINIYDAFGKEITGSQLSWGFSAFIQYDGHVILFDGGMSADILAGNATALGVDLRKVGIAVLSHRHPDHASGLDYLLEINPGVKLYLPKDGRLGAADCMRVGRVPERLGLSSHEVYFRGPGKVLDRPSGRFWKADRHFVDAIDEVVPGVFLNGSKSGK